MFEGLALLAGATLILLALFDAIATTLALNGGGPMTRVAARLSQLHGAAHGKQRLLSLRGPAALLLTFAVWGVLLWVGWTLLFLAFDQAVVNTGNGTPAVLWERALFVASALTTLDTGILRPGLPAYQVLAPLVAISVLLLTVLAISYLLAVLSAVADKRRLAFHILSLGATPEQMVRSSWNGTDFRGLENQLLSMTPGLILLAQRHQAYPVLHAFAAVDRDSSTSLSLAVLNEAITILLHGIPNRAQPDSTILLPARRAVAKFLRTLPHRQHALTEAPPVPRLDALRLAGVPVLDEASFHKRLQRMSGLRAELYDLIRSEGWSGQDVWETGPTPSLQPPVGA